MSPQTLPTLNMAGWSILDYELALDGVRQLSNAATWLQNQPRSYDSATMNYHPGADFIVQVGENWCSQQIDDIAKHLRTIRFPDAGDDDRRVRLLIMYEADYGPSGMPVAELIQMALQQSVRPAAA